MKRLSLFLLVLWGCRADPTIKIEQVEAPDPAVTDTGPGEVVVPPDTADPEPDEGPRVFGLTAGYAHADPESYTWQTVSGTCSVSALTRYADGTLTMPVGTSAPARTRPGGS